MNVARPRSRRHHHSPTRATLSLMVVAGGFLAESTAASASPTLPSIAAQSPVATSLAWFTAINQRNMPLALAHFTPGARDTMRWATWPPPFRRIHCALTSATRSSAAVYCTFANQNDPASGMSDVSFWSIELHRTSTRRWLISNYGQA